VLLFSGWIRLWSCERAHYRHSEGDRYHGGDVPRRTRLSNRDRGQHRGVPKDTETAQHGTAMVLPLILPTRSPTAPHGERERPPQPHRGGCAVARAGSRSVGCPIRARDAAVAGEPLWRAKAEAASVGEACGRCCAVQWVGLKGAGRSANPDDASTGAERSAQRVPGAERSGAFTVLLTQYHEIEYPNTELASEK